MKCEQDSGEAYLDGNTAKKNECQGEWNEMSVGDISVKVTKGTTPAGAQFIDQGINFIKVESITDDGRIDLNRVAHIDDATNTTLSRSILKQNDVLFTIAGTIGRVAFVPEKILPANTNQAVAIVRPNLEVVVPRFLYYSLNDKSRAKQIYARVVQSVQANFSLGELSSLKVLLPPFHEQHAIANILGTLDDKIELNRRINETLEAMAQALFKSWFVDFDPVRAKMEGRPTGLSKEIEDLFPDSFEDSELGEIPKGWKVSTIGECFRLTMGQSPPGETYNDNEEGLPFFQGSTDFDFRYPVNRKFCSAPTRVAISEDTLVSVRAPVGDINMAWEKCCIGRGVASIRHKSGKTSYTYYVAWNLQAKLQEYEHTGTVFGAINKKQLEIMKIIEPSEILIGRFESIVRPLDCRIRFNTYESRTLAALRDTLLPNLLSGDIRLSNLISEK
jgi:Restriction endonuclease S subunits